MKTLTEFQIVSGCVTAVYSVEDDHGDIFVRNILDAEMGTPMDSIHVDDAALLPLGLALIAAHRVRQAAGDPVVVTFPVQHGSGLARDGRG